ncbi:MAG: RDD family protein [Xanthobacteraceae bacterium]
MMSNDPERFGDAGEPRLHAFDPLLNPELFEGVLSRRVIAFIIDVVVIATPVVLAAIFIFLFGIVTLGVGWLLYWLLSPATIIWAVVYYGMTLGGPHSATIGMRMVDIEMRTWYGAPSYFVLGAVHAVLYWVSVSALTPLILLVCFFNHRRRLLHDIVLGTVVINNAERADRLRQFAFHL